MDDIVLETGQITSDTVFMDGSQYTVDDILSHVDDVLDKVREGQWGMGISVARNLGGHIRYSGIALAKLLHGMAIEWSKSGKSFEEFESSVVPMVGVSPITVKRYIDAWSVYLLAPDELKPQVLTQPLKNLYLLGGGLSKGLELSDEQWKEIIEDRQEAVFRARVNEAKNRSPKSNSILIYLEANGDIVAWNNGERYFVGTLLIEELDVDIVRRAIERIIKNASIIRR